MGTNAYRVVPGHVMLFSSLGRLTKPETRAKLNRMVAKQRTQARKASKRRGKP